MLEECDNDIKKVGEKLNFTELQVQKYIKMYNISNMPSKDMLEKYLKKMSKEDVAKHYKTTRTTLRKWIKSYDLSHIRFIDKTHKRIKVIENGKEIEYDSVKDVCKALKIGKNKVNEYLDKNEEYNGYKFELIEKKTK